MVLGSDDYYGPPLAKVPRAPARIAGRYDLHEELGRGSFGKVHRATDRLTRREVAVKLLHREAGPERLRREVVALRGLRLPGVVQLLDEGAADGCFFLVMELVEGQRFPGSGPARSWQALEPAALGLLEVMGRVHAAGAVHMDLKPSNVLVAGDGSVRILDLGLAGGEALGGAWSGVPAAGTRRYAAPEQILREPVDARADLYTIGVMLYEALSGDLPHAGPPTARLYEDPRPLAVMAPDVPARVCEVVDGLLCRVPGARPASAWEALDRLAPAQAPMVMVGPDAGPVSAQALRALFHGPERVLHLPSDAASALLQRTGGEPARVEAELGRWIRAGVVVLEGRKLRVHRDALAQLDRLLPAAEVDRDAHIAGLITGGRAGEVPAAAVSAARALLADGRLDDARVAVEQALLLIRRREADPALEPALLALVALVALEQQRTHAFDVALYEISRATERTPALDSLETLLRAALHVEAGDRERARAALDRVAPFEDPALEVWRYRIRRRLAASQGADQEAEVLRAEVLPRARALDAPELEAQALSWLGRLRYGQMRFEEAARLQAQAVACSTSATARLGNLLHEASAWMETGRYEVARAPAAQVREEACALRLRVFEGRAEWLLRAIAYREGSARAPDLELVEAAGHLEVAYVEALICLNEAAVAWRCRELARGHELAMRARARFEAEGMRGGTALAHALALVCGGGAQDETHPSARTLGMQILSSSQVDDDVSWQILGLLSRVPGGETWREHAARLAAARPDAARRRDVLAPCEVLAQAARAH